MTFYWQRIGVASVLLLTACAPKQSSRAAPPPAPLRPAPPPPRQNLVVLLPDPSGHASGIAITNSGGTQILSQPYEAVRVERADTSPTTPFPMEESEVRRVFGSLLDVLPAAEVVFTLYFAEGSDVLQPESQAQIPAILNTIRERRSTAITITGHTDTTADPQFNYQLGLRRADRVAAILRARGMDRAHLFVTSHGEANPAVKTGRGVSERLNRRVEVVVR